MIQLKRGQRNDYEKNKDLKSTITKIDDESQSYIKDILDICSDENKNNDYNINNLNRNAGKFAASAASNPRDLNTINLNNFEILYSN